jgi:hypothetical protein
LGMVTCRYREYWGAFSFSRSSRRIAMASTRSAGTDRRYRPQSGSKPDVRGFCMGHTSCEMPGVGRVQQPKCEHGHQCAVARQWRTTALCGGIRIGYREQSTVPRSTPPHMTSVPAGSAFYVQSHLPQLTHTLQHVAQPSEAVLLQGHRGGSQSRYPALEHPQQVSVPGGVGVAGTTGACTCSRSPQKCGAIQTGAFNASMSRPRVTCHVIANGPNP